MKRRMGGIILLIVCVAVIFLVSLSSIGISSVKLGEAVLEDLKKKYPDKDILVAHLVQSTGPSWEIVNYPENTYSELVILDFPFDPKNLKQNREWDFLGLDVKFIIVAQKESGIIKHPGVDEDFRLIRAEKIFIDEISYKEDVGDLKLKDLSAEGLFKAFVGFFSSSARYSY